MGFALLLGFGRGKPAAPATCGPRPAACGLRTAARVHLVTKPVRRCYLSSFAGAGSSFFKEAATAQGTAPSAAETAGAGQPQPVVDRPDKHSWAAGPTSGQTPAPSDVNAEGAAPAEERRTPSAAVINTTLRVLVGATEDDLMDSLEHLRLKAEARLASLFAQSVAEGHNAHDEAPTTGADAWYNSEAKKVKGQVDPQQLDPRTSPEHRTPCSRCS